MGVTSRTDLCGGRLATAVPSAIPAASSTRLVSSDNVYHDQICDTIFNESRIRLRHQMNAAADPANRPLVTNHK